IKASSLQKAVATHEEKVGKIDSLESQVGGIQASVDKSARDVNSLSRTTQDAFNTVAADLGNIHASLTKLEDAQKKQPAVAASKGGSKEPAVAGPDEYVVKSGDTGSKIARAQGISLADLLAVNPGVNWNALHAGQKIKLPKK
ncbi:MAG TPA: LysM domain-containing protein, partial [Opitutus sp.]|nr:LysM domain-containing protein [Opitutus sp.]